MGIGESLKEHWLRQGTKVRPGASEEQLCAFESRWGVRQDRQAFLVVQALGRGRAAYVGAEDTWAWRAGTGDDPHFRAFWVGLIRWLAKRDQEDRGGGSRQGR